MTVRDIIDFDYIIQLIAGLKDISSEVIRKKKTEEILSIFDRDANLRKKKDLIKKSIENNLPHVKKDEDVEKAFDEFWESERSTALHDASESENIPQEKFEKIIREYLYSQKLPQQPRILEREKIINRVKSAVEKIVDVFEW